MSSINIHQPYKGRENNRYTYKIQKLYETQYLLQEITKELYKIIKQTPEYRNKNNANINLYINEITNSQHISKKYFGLVLYKFYESKAKSEPLDIINLIFLRKTLQRSIERLPVPQNNNKNKFSNNLEENYNKPLTGFTPKSETKKMTEKEKLKIQRKIADKSKSKSGKSRNLQMKRM